MPSPLTSRPIPKLGTLFLVPAACVRCAGVTLAVVSGVRVVYFNRLANGEIWLLLIYGKSARENIPSHVLRQIKEEIENA